MENGKFNRGIRDGKFNKVTREKEIKSLFRLAVRTSRCGRDNPGSNPGRDKYLQSVSVSIFEFLSYSKMP